MSDMENIDKWQELDLVSLLDAPSDYSEEELRAFFSDAENKSDYRLYYLLRMAECQDNVPLPDVDKVWNQFQRDVVSSDSAERSSVRPDSRYATASSLSGQKRHISVGRRILTASWISAAAILIGVLFYISVSPSFLTDSRIIAMEYDDRPQLVLLESEFEQLETFVQKDSILFFPSVSLPVEPVALSASDNEVVAKMRTLSTPRGVDFKITLPDGTEVWLNAESSLQFPSAFTSETRKVILTGEAYFKVAHDESNPFIVETEKMNVRVLGTEFNFRNYMSEQPQVSLVEGSISIQDETLPDGHIVLQPGQGASVGGDGNIYVQEVDTYGITQWVNGYFYFRNRPLVEILQELGRWYNVGVIFENTHCISDKMHFSALRSDTLQQALDNLNRLQKVNITLEGNNIVVR